MHWENKKYGLSILESYNQRQNLFIDLYYDIWNYVR